MDQLSKLSKSIKIGNVKIKPRLVLAPMAGITDVAFRLLCKEQGAGLVFTEMVSAEALTRSNKKSSEIAIVCDEERPIAIQLFGANIDSLKNATKRVKDDADIIDINFGCPAFKIQNVGAGSALLKDKKKIHDIVSSLLRYDIPVTAKIRIGYDEKNINAVEVAKEVEKAGASAITVHGRTVVQGYSGRADWSVIKEVKDNVDFPVIGNGDVKTEEDLKNILEQTNCDMVMIGRAAIGSPFIFKRLLHYIETKDKLSPQSAKEKIDCFFKYLDLAKKYKLDNVANVKIKAMNFTKGIKGSTELRGKITKAKSIEEINNLIKNTE